MVRKINRGDIFYAKLGHTLGSEQWGNRLVVIVQNDIGNKYSPTTIILPITKKIHRKAKLPTHYNLKADYLNYDSTILAEQIRVIDKRRLKRKLGKLDTNIMKILDTKIKIALDLNT